MTADLIPFGGPKLGSCGVANKAEVVSGCETLEGAVRFYSKKIPETDISAFIILLEQGQEGGGSGMASSDEAEEMLDEVFPPEP